MATKYRQLLVTFTGDDIMDIQPSFTTDTAPRQTVNQLLYERHVALTLASTVTFKSKHFVIILNYNNQKRLKIL